MVKFGFFGKERFQRYRCKQCGKTFSYVPERPLDDLRVPMDKALQVLHLLVEGVGIRACERLTGINKKTVLAILEVAGRKCARLLDRKVRDVSVEFVQLDELWSFVNAKQINAKHPEHGDAYTFLAIDRKSKLIISHFVGKRDAFGAYSVMASLHKRIATHCQITTDGFAAYIPAVFSHFRSRVDFAQLIKQYGQPDWSLTERRYSPGKCIGARVGFRTGYPVEQEICTSHVERTNLSVRLFTRRFTRLTLGYSKKLANLKHAVVLFVAHFNFCRKHSAHGFTPAMEAGLTDHTWTIQELLSES